MDDTQLGDFGHGRSVFPESPMAGPLHPIENTIIPATAVIIILLISAFIFSSRWIF